MRKLISLAIALLPILGQAQTAATTQPDGLPIQMRAVCPGGGIACLIGPAGPAGPQGVPGLAGPAGQPGAPGVAGAVGAQGPAGPAGVLGAQGPVGPQGLIGPQGPAGTPGPQGPVGLTGPAGVAGAAGATGATGLVGATGATGPQGPAGPAGVCSACSGGSTVTPLITRTLAGCPVGYGDMYWNSPVNMLPVSYLSPKQIASLGEANLGPSPEFLLNVGDNTTPTTSSSAMVWDQGNPGEFDSGNYPFNANTLVSNYIFGAPGAVSSGGVPGNDNHVLMLNSSTCLEYETFNLQNSTPPYHNSAGTIVDWKSYTLKTAQKYLPSTLPGNANDSDGLDNGTASGIPVWPMVLTHDEVFGVGGSAAQPAVAPINHGVRFALSGAQVDNGFQWPATHSASGRTGANAIFMGATFRLKASFNSTTCGYRDNAGQAFPAWFQNVIADLQQYGLYLTDTGTTGLIGTDASQAWGNPGLATSDNWIFAGWLHCIQESDLEIVDNTPRVISTTSGQVNQNFPAR